MEIYKEKLNNTSEYCLFEIRKYTTLILTLFKEIQPIGWLNFVTGADLL